jgi:hypothetical protein
MGIQKKNPFTCILPFEGRRGFKTTNHKGRIVPLRGFVIKT